jgi:hypothetical protein
MIIPLFPVLMVDSNQNFQTERSCPQCRAPVPDDARFCGACRQPLTPTSAGVCVRCGQVQTSGAAFCMKCGQSLAMVAEMPPALPSLPASRGAAFPSRPLPKEPHHSGKMVFTAFLLAVLGTAGYLGYRYWPAGVGPAGFPAAPASQGKDASWPGATDSAPDLAVAGKEITPHLDTLSRALTDGDFEKALGLTLPEVREDFRLAFQGQPQRMERFGKLLQSRRLTAIGSDLAELEVTENGKTFAITLQRIGNRWILHSF